MFQPPLVIGLIADTHLFPDSTRSLSSSVLSFFQRSGVGLVLHAGDANNVGVLERLTAVAPVIAVAGNNDDADLQRRLPQREVVKAGKFSVGLVHGHGGRSARMVAFDSFATGFDVVVYGHSHIPKLESRDGCTFFNPGSPTDRRWSPHFGIGLLHVMPSSLQPELVLFRSPDELDSLE